MSGLRGSHHGPRATTRTGAPRRTARIPAAPRTAPRLDSDTRSRGITERTARRRAAKRTARIQLAGMLAIVAAALLIGWSVSRPPSPRPPGTSSAHAGGTEQYTAEEALDLVVPTPGFATYGQLRLRLPVRPNDLTELGFHQASGKLALHMISTLPDADSAAAAEHKGTGRVPFTAQLDEEVPISGGVLRMWRSNRSGPPDSAVDIGAEPGTPVYSPVSGTVLLVRPYKLYGKHDDFEIHIQPDNCPDIDVVLIHVENPVISAGDRVVAGVTRLAQVRRLSDRVNHQLAYYSTTSGDHVHMQLNRLEIPGVVPEPEGS